MTSNIARISGSAADVARHETVLRRGLHWLYNTEQPDDAVLQHHGETLRSQPNRKLTFIPTSGLAGHTVIVVAVDSVEYGPTPQRRCLNPLDAGELLAFAELLADLGEGVVRTWNGHPHFAGSLALTRPAHPSLRAAVRRYHTGCPTHQSVFCNCGWYAAGNRRLTHIDDIDVPADDLMAVSQ